MSEKELNIANSDCASQSFACRLWVIHWGEQSSAHLCARVSEFARAAAQKKCVIQSERAKRREEEKKSFEKHSYIFHHCNISDHVHDPIWMSLVGQTLQFSLTLDFTFRRRTTATDFFSPRRVCLSVCWAVFFWACCLFSLSSWHWRQSLAARVYENSIVKLNVNFEPQTVVIDDAERAKRAPQRDKLLTVARC